MEGSARVRGRGRTRPGEVLAARVQRGEQGDRPPGEAGAARRRHRASGDQRQQAEQGRYGDTGDYTRGPAPVTHSMNPSRPCPPALGLPPARFWSLGRRGVPPRADNPRISTFE
ncbi:hypothetical protein GCM10023238_20930 [Streptomyces heliomycini]